ncbi:hypothetical protein C3L33_22832, partial [Rhododendron williamsianum]
MRSKSPIPSSARPGTPPSCSPPSGGGVGGVSYIEHRVSKMDTLAGVAIKYGVENLKVGIGARGARTSVDSLNLVRKSSSTSSLQDQENGLSSSSSIWAPPKWNLKSDLQALSTAAITRPIFDGLPKPMTGRRNKAALD